MIQIAIDGASRNNGKPDCTSGSGAIIVRDNSYFTMICGETLSTNQRGEINALLLALGYCLQNSDKEAQIITDSEYLFNTVTKRWYVSWKERGWLTKEGNPVKNRDLWEAAAELLYKLDDMCAMPMLYHIKGHLIPDGGQEAMRLLDKDVAELYQLYEGKFEQYVVGNETKITKAQELSNRNNGFNLDYETFKRFVVLNGIADRLAVRALIDAKY